MVRIAAFLLLGLGLATWGCKRVDLLPPLGGPPSLDGAVRVRNDLGGLSDLVDVPAGTKRVAWMVVHGRDGGSLVAVLSVERSVLHGIVLRSPRVERQGPFSIDADVARELFPRGFQFATATRPGEKTIDGIGLLPMAFANPGKSGFGNGYAVALPAVGLMYLFLYSM